MFYILFSTYNVKTSSLLLSLSGIVLFFILQKIVFYVKKTCHCGIVLLIYKHFFVFMYKKNVSLCGIVLFFYFTKNFIFMLKKLVTLWNCTDFILQKILLFIYKNLSLCNCTFFKLLFY